MEVLDPSKRSCKEGHYMCLYTSWKLHFEAICYKYYRYVRSMRKELWWNWLWHINVNSLLLNYSDSYLSYYTWKLNCVDSYQFSLWNWKFSTFSSRHFIAQTLLYSRVSWSASKGCSTGPVLQVSDIKQLETSDIGKLVAN